MTKNETFLKIGNSPTGKKNYYISNFGRCKTHDNITNTDTISRGNLNPYTGYYTFNGQYVHRLVARYFIKNPNPEIFTEVDHIRPIKSRNTVKNIRWITPSQNRARKSKRLR